MAKIKLRPKLILDETEKEVLLKAKMILISIDGQEGEAEIFEFVDNLGGGWDYLITALDNLLQISEEE